MSGAVSLLLHTSLWYVTADQNSKGNKLMRVNAEIQLIFSRFGVLHILCSACPSFHHLCFPICLCISESHAIPYEENHSIQPNPFSRASVSVLKSGRVSRLRAALFTHGFVSSFLHRFQIRELSTGISICIHTDYIFDFISDPALVQLHM